jgi:hypothetical protein
MRIASLLALFFAVAALSGAVAQPAAEQKGAPSGDLILRQGSWTQTGLTVAERDTLVFTFRPSAEVQQWMANTGSSPTYSMQIGERVYQVTDGRTTAPAGGSLAVRAAFPFEPASRWPEIAMTVRHEPLPPVSLGPEGPVELNKGNTTIGRPDGDIGEIGRDPRPDRDRSPYRDGAANRASQSTDDWSWLFLPLTGGLGAGFILGFLFWSLRQPPAEGDSPLSGEPPPPVTIVLSPSLDPLEGRLGGNEIALAGPEIRLGTALESGATRYRDVGPIVEREERDGGA